MTAFSSHYLRYWETLRHLRPQQVVGRLLSRLAKPRPDLRASPDVRKVSGIWVRPVARPASLVGPRELRLLNETRSLERVGWDNTEVPKLWRYNQHYFDDLMAADAALRSNWHRDMIDFWITANRIGSGTGWEPYPTSLRVVNWIKWALGGNLLTRSQAHSLAIQVRWLMKRLEFHLLGNHLFANAKALIFAGSYFSGPEAEVWRQRGIEIIDHQLPEQVLPDGGQFELSPMYHALALEDLLDLINVSRATNTPLPPSLEQSIPAMRTWLAAMVHPDGEIAFFNDAAKGVAPKPGDLEEYAQALGYPPTRQGSGNGHLVLKDSGYIRLEAKLAVALLDVARVGPDYLPGHAHADTLSFELSISGRRAIVNSGTSVYGPGPERQRQRGTAAHSTVVIDGKDSSEVWSSFRVARRARPVGLSVEQTLDGWRVKCGHDGYRWLPDRPHHRRSWQIDDGSLTVADSVIGPRVRATAIFHLHPALTAVLSPDGTGHVCVGEEVLFEWSVERGVPRLENGTWHPEFGISMPNRRLIIDLAGNEALVRFSWGQA